MVFHKLLTEGGKPRQKCESNISFYTPRFREGLLTNNPAGVKAKHFLISAPIS